MFLRRPESYMNGSSNMGFLGFPGSLWVTRSTEHSYSRNQGIQSISKGHPRSLGPKMSNKTHAQRSMAPRILRGVPMKPVFTSYSFTRCTKTQGSTPARLRSVSISRPHPVWTGCRSELCVLRKARSRKPAYLLSAGTGTFTVAKPRCRRWWVRQRLDAEENRVRVLTPSTGLNRVSVPWG